MLVSRVCEICGCYDPVCIFRQKFRRMSGDAFLKSYDVVVCNCCGFAYADQIPGQEVFDAYYREFSKYEYQYTQGHESEHDLQRFKAIVDLVLPYLHSSEARLLDFGCATGRLLSLFKAKGFHNLLGLDPSRQAVATARELFEVEVTNETLDSLAEQMQQFDCVLLSGVLEHVGPLARTLGVIKSILSTDGLVFIEVPDAEGFPGRPDAPYQEFSSEHINFFTGTTLTNLMRKCGFVPVCLQPSCRTQSSSTEMPVVSAIYRKCDLQQEWVLSYNDTSLKALGNYVQESRLIDEHINKTINLILTERLPIIVWGVGTHTMRLLETSRLKDADIRAFVDTNRNYHHRTLEGIAIISPTELALRFEPILVSTRVFQEEIVRMIKDELQLQNQIITLYKLL